MSLSRRALAVLVSMLAVLGLQTVAPAPAQAYSLSTQMDQASAYAAGRGQVGITVIDRETGFLSENQWSHTRMRSASLVKLFVADNLLSRARAGQLTLSPTDRARLEVMIRSSDDAAMSNLYSRFGGQGMVVQVAQKYGLSELGLPPTPSYWGMYQLTAHDVAKYYRGMLDGGLHPHDRDYLVTLMRQATRNGTDGFDQFAGIPQAMPGETWGIKQGWMCCQENQRRLHTSGILGSDNRFIAVVLSQVGSGSSYAYAGETLTGVVQRLFPGGRLPAPHWTRNPVGSLDAVTEVSPGVFRVRGWTLDPDAGTGPTRVDTYVDDVGHSSRLATESRPDVAAAYPGMGAAHGFSFDVRVPDGRHRICLFAINSGNGTSNTVFCRDVVAHLSPVGSLDVVAVAGVRAVTVRGWTADPDAGTAANEAHVYAGTAGAALVADRRREDVGRVYPQFGPDHGFSGTVNARQGGSQSVCAFGINHPGGSGSNTLLGCRTVVLPRDVIGHLDTVRAAPGSVRVTGWALDTAAGQQPVRVDLWADGSTPVGSVQATQARPDVKAVYPDTSGTSGYDATFALSPGSHVVCAYGIPVSSQSSTRQLGCSTVVVP